MLLIRTYANGPDCVVPPAVLARWNVRAKETAQWKRAIKICSAVLFHWHDASQIPLERPRQGNGAVEAGHKDLLRCAVSLARRFADRTVCVGTSCQDNFA